MYSECIRYLLYSNTFDVFVTSLSSDDKKGHERCVSNKEIGIHGNLRVQESREVERRVGE